MCESPCCLQVPSLPHTHTHTHIKPPPPRSLPLIKLQPALLPDRAQLQLWMHYRHATRRHTAGAAPPAKSWGPRGPRRPWGVRKHCMPSARPSTRPQNHHQGRIKGWLAADRRERAITHPPLPEVDSLQLVEVASSCLDEQDLNAVQQNKLSLTPAFSTEISSISHYGCSKEETQAERRRNIFEEKHHQL